MKAVIPAAGLGTGFLPATKEQPKEILPVVDGPAIHWVVEEAIAAGVTDLLIIMGREKRAIEDYFDGSLRWDHYLKANHQEGALRELEELASKADFHFIRQKEPRGLGGPGGETRRFADEFDCLHLGANARMRADGLSTTSLSHDDSVSEIIAQIQRR